MREGSCEGRGKDGGCCGDVGFCVIGDLVCTGDGDLDIHGGRLSGGEGDL